MKVHRRVNSSETAKYLIFLLANRVMAWSKLERKDRKQVLVYSATIILYDHGYKKVKGSGELTKTWEKRLEAAYLSGADTNPLETRYKRRISLADRLDKEHPGYIRQLYRYAEKIIGNQASFEDLARTMNCKSFTEEEKPETKFNRVTLHRWFNQQGGKAKSPMEKPYLSQEQKKGRKEWCVREKARMEQYGTQFYACFLDEKWFYLTSRRRKIKILPPGMGEDSNEVSPHIPTSVSRRHAIKVRKSVVVVMWCCRVVLLRCCVVGVVWCGVALLLLLCCWCCWCWCGVVSCCYHAALLCCCAVVLLWWCGVVVVLYWCGVVWCGVV